MIIVDTNVVSEIVKPTPDETVKTWFSQNRMELCLTSITIYELLAGLRFLPEGKRRKTLEEAINTIIGGFGNRILSFTSVAAEQCANMKYHSIKSGKTPQTEDLMIAAITKTKTATLATRNTKDFEHLDIKLINPFLP